MVKRYGWKNKKIPFEKRGFYEITCPICGERNRFIIEAKSIPYHNSRVVNNILNSEYYMARPVTKESRRWAIVWDVRLWENDFDLNFRFNKSIANGERRSAGNI